VKKIRCFSIYLQYSTAYFAEGMPHLESLERRLFGRREFRRIIIDNQLQAGDRVFFDGQTLYGGDNGAHEFSGWEFGLKMLEREFALEQSDVILFSNDSFFRNYDPTLQMKFKRKHIKQTSEGPLMTGVLDTFPEPILIEGKERRCWVRSNCFLINYGLLRKIGSLVHPMPREAFFSGEVPGFFSTNAPLHDRYKTFLRIWLLQEKSDSFIYSDHWYKSEPLNKANISFLSRKAYCILCEHHLSFAVCDNGGRLLNILPPEKETPIKKVRTITANWIRKILPVIRHDI